MYDCRIWHDGRNWIAENETFRTEAPTLDALDMGVAGKMRESGVLGKGQTAEVRMLFDNSTIPQWIRQYAQHYFNRIVTLQG